MANLVPSNMNSLTSYISAWQSVISAGIEHGGKTGISVQSTALRRGVLLHTAHTRINRNSIGIR